MFKKLFAAPPVRPLLGASLLALGLVAGTAGAFVRPAAADGPRDPSGPTTTRTRAANERFVTHLYQDALGRNPDRVGLARTLAALERGTSRYQVATSVLTSNEYRARLVTLQYQSLLGREPGTGELNQFVGFLSQGGTAEQLRATMIGSGEYYQKRGGSTNLGFLTALYQDVLHRSLDRSSEAAFMQVLAQGAPRATVASAVISSVEGRQVLVQSFMQHYLRRDASAGELATMTSALGQGTMDEAIIAGIVASDEYFQRP